MWSPLQLSSRAYYESQFPIGFSGQVNISNHYSFTNTSQCRFTWKLLNFAAPWQARTSHTVVAQGTPRSSSRSSSIAPGASGAIEVRLPFNWQACDALSLWAFDPSGRGITSWTWPIKKAASSSSSIVQTARGDAKVVTASEDAIAITMAAGGTEISISKSTGRLVSVRHNGQVIALGNRPTLASGTATFSEITQAAASTWHEVQANYSGNLSSVRWRLHGSGCPELSYRYNLSSAQDFMGVSFDLPEKQVTGVRWLGQEPHRVWKNRMRGVSTGVWAKSTNDTSTGADKWA